MGTKNKCLIGSIIVIFGCSPEEPRETIVTQPPVIEVLPVVVQPPNFISDPNKSGYESWIKDNGSFLIKNLTNQVQTYHAYSYKVYAGGEQQRLDYQTGTVQPNDEFYGKLATVNCHMQLDLSNFGPEHGEPNRGELGARYINTNNPCVNPTPTTKPSPRPTPCPSPTPTPCITSKHKKCKK